MRKIIKAGICLAAAAMVVSGCGKSDTKETTPAETTVPETTADPALTDEASLKLGAYTGMDLTTETVSVSDSEVENQVSYLVSMNPTVEEVTDRAAALDDTVNIDYVGKKDGVAFDGGTASGFDLKLGSGQFIPGFEDGVVGMKTGDEKDIDVTFPDPYENDPSLAGQPVVFHVKLNAVKTETESTLDDKFAKRMTGDVAATVDSLKTQVRDQILSEKERNAFLDTGNQALQQVIENSEITCDPDAVEQMYQNLQNTYSMYASQYGMDLEQFLQLFMGVDLDGLKTNSENLVKQQMILDEVAKKENIVATDEQKEGIAKASNFQSAEELVQAYGEESADQLFTMEATYHFLVDNSNVTEVELTAAETAAEISAPVSTSAAAAEPEASVSESEKTGETVPGTVEMTTKAN